MSKHPKKRNTLDNERELSYKQDCSIYNKATAVRSSYHHQAPVQERTGLQSRRSGNFDQLPKSSFVRNFQMHSATKCVSKCLANIYIYKGGTRG